MYELLHFCHYDINQSFLCLTLFKTIIQTISQKIGAIEKKDKREVVGKPHSHQGKQPILYCYIFCSNMHYAA